MGDSTPGIGIIQPQRTITVLQQVLMMLAALNSDGGRRAVLIWTTASLKSFFDVAASLVRLR